jgi:hypothetical protein
LKSSFGTTILGAYKLIICLRLNFPLHWGHCQMNKKELRIGEKEYLKKITSSSRRRQMTKSLLLLYCHTCVAISLGTVCHIHVHKEYSCIEFRTHKVSSFCWNSCFSGNICVKRGEEIWLKFHYIIALLCSPFVSFVCTRLYIYT